MKSRKGEVPERFKRGQERWRIAAVALIATGASDKTAEIVGKIIESAMNKGHKSDAINLLKELDEATRREVASTFSVFQQFSEQVMCVCTSIAIEMNDSYAVKTDGGITGTLNLGDDNELPGVDPDLVYEGPSTKAFKDLHQHQHDMPPQIAFLKSMLEALTGLPVGVEAMEPDQFERLQDDYEPSSDPIAELARKLDRMPGKKIRLPKKSLPEC